MMRRVTVVAGYGIGAVCLIGISFDAPQAASPGQLRRSTSLPASSPLPSG